MLHRQKNNSRLYLRIRELARDMRKNATEAEDFFWEKVRDRRLFGLKINRQFIIACRLEGDFIKYYIADFHCHALKVIFELDGQIHLRQQEDDMIRTERMNEYGFIVIRFTNEQVLTEWDSVEKKIKEFIDFHRSSPGL